VTPHDLGGNGLLSSELSIRPKENPSELPIAGSKNNGYASKTKNVNPSFKERHRSLSQFELRDIINDIYLKKVSHNKMKSELGQPHETMSQYLYTFLKQKFGLKNLIMEYTSLILVAVKEYASAHADTLLFAKMLRNHVNERFIDDQRDFSASCMNILQQYTREQYKHTNEDVTRSILKSRFGPNGCIPVVHCLDCARYLYEGDERSKVINSLKSALGAIGVNIADESENEGQVPHALFMETVLRHNILHRESILQKFNDLFSTLDSDGDGVIGPDECASLMASLVNDKTFDPPDSSLSYPQCSDMFISLLESRK